MGLFLPSPDANVGVLLFLPASGVNDGEESLHGDGDCGPDGAGEGDLHEGEEPGKHHRVVVHLRSRNICTWG
jgi:hypothetical protein